MVDPKSIGSALGNVFNTQMIDALVRYMGYTLTAVVILAVFVLIYLFIQYKYKVTWPILHISKGGTTAEIIGYKHDRARKIKVKGVEKTHFLFSRKTLPPDLIDQNYVKPGNKVPLLRVGENEFRHMPSLIVEEGTISDFTALKPEWQYWNMLSTQEANQAYQSEDAHKRIMFMTVATVVFCLIAAGFAVWASVKAPNRIAESFDKFGSSFMQVAKSIGGSPP